MPGDDSLRRWSKDATTFASALSEVAAFGGPPPYTFAPVGEDAAHVATVPNHRRWSSMWSWLMGWRYARTLLAASADHVRSFIDIGNSDRRGNLVLPMLERGCLEESAAIVHLLDHTVSPQERHRRLVQFHIEQVRNELNADVALWNLASGTSANRFPRYQAGELTMVTRGRGVQDELNEWRAHYVAEGFPLDGNGKPLTWPSFTALATNLGSKFDYMNSSAAVHSGIEAVLERLGIEPSIDDGKGNFHRAVLASVGFLDKALEAMRIWTGDRHGRISAAQRHGQRLHEATVQMYRATGDPWARLWDTECEQAFEWQCGPLPMRFG